MTPQEKAKLLIQGTQEALNRGTKHYTVDGKPLTTVKEILEALVQDSEIIFKPVTT